MNSWDVFDTLITRFIPDPMQVFSLIDRRHPGLDFSARRLEAQATLDKIGKPYVIYDIYRQMAQAGLAPETATALLRDELATERAMLLPVRSAVEQIGASDLLISDMYLPGELISGMLAEICDLHGALPVIRSNWGKSTGTIWPKLLEHYVIRTHYGDNPHSDGAIPGQFGINTVLLRDIALTEWEQNLIQLGLGQLALIQRETRLRSLHADAGIFEKLAAGPYVSLLLGYAGYLANSFGKTAAFGFLSRDCDDLASIFRAMFPSIRCFNIDLSRRLTRDATNDSIFNALLPEDCVLVDVVSTGRSISAMLSRLGRGGQPFHTLLFLDHLLSAEAIAVSSVKCVFKSSEFGNRHYPLELLLQSAYPPVTCITADTASGGLVKAFGAPELSVQEARLIKGKCEIVTNFLRSIRLRGLPPLNLEQNQALIRAALEAILQSGLQPSAFASFLARERFAPF